MEAPPEQCRQNDQHDANDNEDVVARGVAAGREAAAAW
jgi:hypothetical protein